MSAQATKALQRGLRLLEIIASRQHGMTFSQLRDALDLSDSVCNRLLQSLIDLTYIRKDQQLNLYLPGPALQRLPSTHTHDHLLRLARPYLQELCETFRNTTLLIANTGRSMLVLERFLHEESMALQAVGHEAKNWRYPPWGWLFKPLSDLKKRKNESDEISDSAIKKELQRLKQDGYVIRVQKDRRRLAVPLYDQQNNTIAAIAIGGTAISLANNDIPKIAAAMIDARDQCQKLLVH